MDTSSTRQKGTQDTELLQELRSTETTLEKEDFLTIAHVLETRRTQDLSTLSADEQYHIIQSRSLNILTEEKLQALFVQAGERGTPLRIKYGIDPTGADVHLGHVVPMIIANRFQRMGHTLVVIVGDVTAKIGDPSGRSKERPPLSDDDIAHNLETYQEQMSPFVDFAKAELRRNSEWLNDITMPEILSILSKVPLSMQMQREDFRKRLESGHSLSTAELLYSIMMAYDSVAIDADVEIGGVDQLLNMQMCRKVMEIRERTPEVIVTTPLIEGTDGSGGKMSKSAGNYIGLNESADELFGKVMSIPDRLLETYYKATTELSDEEWNVLDSRMQDGTLNPVYVKKLLAYDIVSVIRTQEEAAAAKQGFDAQFSKRTLSALNDIPTVDLSDTITAEKTVLAVLTDLEFVTSNSNGRKLAQSGGIQLVGEGVDENTVKITEEEVLQTTVSELIEKHMQGEYDATFLKVGRKVARIQS